MQLRGLQPIVLLAAILSIAFGVVLQAISYVPIGVTDPLVFAATPPTA